MVINLMKHRWMLDVHNRTRRSGEELWDLPWTGQITKACNQVVVAPTIETVAEGPTLARRAGVDPARVRQAPAEGGRQPNSRVAWSAYGGAAVSTGI